MSAKRKRYIECGIQLQLIRGRDILSFKKRIKRIGSKIQSTSARIQAEYPEETQEFDLLMKMQPSSAARQHEIEERMLELQSLWEEFLLEAAHERDSIHSLLDPAHVISYLELDLYMGNDFEAAEFPFESLVEEFFDATDLLWPDQAHKMLSKIDREKLLLFPDLVPLYFLIRRCAEENHVLKIIYDA